MNLTIDIVPDLESQLLQVAARQGVDPSQYVVDAVRVRLQADSVPRLDAEQSQLIDEINAGLTEPEWDRYHELVELRQGGTISDGEFAELVAMSDDIEARNARRMERLSELARLRGTTLPALMGQLGILPPPVM
jgi:hypothetical protein